MINRKAKNTEVRSTTEPMVPVSGHRANLFTMVAFWGAIVAFSTTTVVAWLARVSVGWMLVSVACASLLGVTVYWLISLVASLVVRVVSPSVAAMRSESVRWVAYIALAAAVSISFIGALVLTQWLLLHVVK